MGYQRRVLGGRRSLGQFPRGVISSFVHQWQVPCRIQAVPGGAESFPLLVQPSAILAELDRRDWRALQLRLSCKEGFWCHVLGVRVRPRYALLLFALTEALMATGRCWLQCAVVLHTCPHLGCGT